MFPHLRNTEMLSTQHSNIVDCDRADNSDGVLKTDIYELAPSVRVALEPVDLFFAA
jgi:hypothetical protein